MPDRDAPRPVALRTGEQVWVRPIERTDDVELRTAFLQLSELSRYRRFFTGASRLTPTALRSLTDVDHVDHEAFVALPARDSATIVAVARYIRNPQAGQCADLAITVTDEWQHRGLGTALLRLLSRRASQAGITRFTLDVLAENRAGLSMVEAAGGVRVSTTGTTVSARIEVADVLGPSP